MRDPGYAETSYATLDFGDYLSLVLLDTGHNTAIAGEQTDWLEKVLRARADRLSACGFCANAFRLLVHTLAYAIVVLFREAVAAVPEVATATVSTLRQRLWKVAARVVTGPRRIRLHLSEAWPYRELWSRVLAAVQRFVGQLSATG